MDGETPSTAYYEYPRRHDIEAFLARPGINYSTSIESGIFYRRRNYYKLLGVLVGVVRRI